MGETLQRERYHLLQLLVVLSLVGATRFYALSGIADLLLLSSLLLYRDFRSQFLKLAVRSEFVYLLLFLFYISISSLWSLNSSGNEIIEEIVSWHKLILYGVCLSVFVRRDQALGVFFAIIIVGLFFCLLSLGLKFFDIKVFWERGPDQMLQNHTVQTIWFVVASFLIVFMCINRLISREHMVFPIVGLGVLQLGCIYLNTSKSGFIAMFFFYSYLMISLFVACYQRWRHKKKYILGLIAPISIAIYFLAIVIVDRGLISVFENSWLQALSALDHGVEESSVRIRVVMWLNSVEIIKEYPIFGTGAGGFVVAYSELVAGLNHWTGTVSDNPHNFYLHVFAEYGVVGLLLFGCFLMAIIRQCLALCDIQNAIHIFCFITMFAILALFNGIFTGFTAGRLFFVCTPLLFFVSHLVSNNRHDS